MIKMWIQPDDCTGCGACANICPKQAIEMQEDNCGFVHPVIGKNCVDCGMCEKTCHTRLKLSNNNINDMKVFSAYSKDEINREISTSGGVFFELAKKMIIDKGIVYGAAYDDDNNVKHIRCKTIEDLNRIRQSKYVQSIIGNIYTLVKKDLQVQKKVLFCGTPCQVAGLKAFLNKEYDNLYTVDFLCRGINSPKAYRCWLSEQEIKNNDKVVNVWFKYKCYGWKLSPYCTKLDFKSGKSIILNRENNSYMISYLNYNLMMRPSCSHCEYKRNNQVSDITLSDFWGAEEDDDKGTSCVSTNTSKGFFLLKEINSGLNIHEISKELQSKNNSLENSSVINPNNKTFLKVIGKNNFSDYAIRYSDQAKKNAFQNTMIFIRQTLHEIKNNLMH